MEEENITFNNNDIISKSFTDTKWKLSEKPLDIVERSRNQILVDLGENVKTDDSLNTGLIVIGDYCYLSIRDKLIKPLKLRELKNNKNNNSKNAKNEKINTKTKLILNNIQVLVNDKLTEVLNYFRENIENVDYNFLMNKFDYIEFRFIILMKFIDIFIRSRNIEALKEILITIKKIKNILKTPNLIFKKIAIIDKFDFSISQVVLEDLYFKEFEIENMENVSLNIVEIVNTNPKLIFQTNYDSTLSIIQLKPYETQINVMNVIKENLHNGFNIHYKTIQGGGKTSLILSVAKFIKHSCEKIKIIFCCSDMLEAVRVQVAKIMFNFNVPFGIGTGYKNSKGNYLYEIKNSWICKKIQKREQIYNLTNEQQMNYRKIEVDDIIICDYISTLSMLKENEEMKAYEKLNNIETTKSFDFMLFFDEPTYGCGTINNIIKIMCQILYNAPNKLILSSATLPSLIEMNVFNEYFLNKYTTSFLKDIKSNKVLIGCLIRNYNGVILTPHQDCINRDELKIFMHDFIEKPLIGKFYTLIYLVNLNYFLVQYGENLNLDQIENFNHSSIISNIVILIERFIQNESIPYDDFINIQCGETENFNVDYSKLLTKDSHKFMGGCLISVSNPLEFVREHFYPIVESIKKKLNIKEITEEYDTYLNSLNEIELRIENLNKNIDKTTQNYENELNEIYKSTYSMKFNDIFEVGSVEHLNSFAPNISYDTSLIKSKIMKENININEFMIEDNLKFLLYMGVGIYSNDYSEKYRDKILELLNEKKLAYFISDESYIYGGNGPLSNILIDDSLGVKLNDNELSQLIGRTGRVGQSWISKIYVQENTYDKLRNYFQNMNAANIESVNISNTFINTMREEMELRIKKDIQKLRLEKERLELDKKEENIKTNKEENIKISEKEREKQNKIVNRTREILRENKMKNQSNYIFERTQTSNIEIFKSDEKVEKMWKRSDTIITNINTQTRIIKEEKIIKEYNTKDKTDLLLKKYF